MQLDWTLVTQIIVLMLGAAMAVSLAACGIIDYYFKHKRS